MYNKLTTISQQFNHYLFAKKLFLICKIVVHLINELYNLIIMEFHQHLQRLAEKLNNSALASAKLRRLFLTLPRMNAVGFLIHPDVSR